MTKKSRPTLRYPGELERLTVLIEGKAREIAELLLRELPDAEREAEDALPKARLAPRKRPNGPGAKRRPDRKRDIKREQAISEWRHKAFRH
jgi:hypothetical protein